MCYGTNICIHSCFHLEVPYSRKIWRGFKLGGLPICLPTAKLKSANVFSSHLCVWRSIPYQTSEFKSHQCVSKVIWGSTTKFNSHQNFRLYSNLIHNHIGIFTFIATIKWLWKDETEKYGYDECRVDSCNEACKFFFINTLLMHKRNSEFHFVCWYIRLNVRFCFQIVALVS